jgi:hypothetical protein
MANLVGSERPGGGHHNRHAASLFRDRGADELASTRWRSRSSPAVAHNFNLQNRWLPGGLAVNGGWLANSQGDLTLRRQERQAQAQADNLERDPSPPANFHASFHDLHAANEMRAGRQDLRELRDLLRQDDMTLHHSTRRSLRERKWPPPVAPHPPHPQLHQHPQQPQPHGGKPHRHRHDDTLCKRCSIAAETEVANPLFRY